jgi:starch synthase
MDRQSLRILFAIAEAYPFAKVGGLADVGGSLPRVLARLGHDVRLVLPGYPCVGTGQAVLTLAIPLGQATEETSLCYHGLHHGVGVYTVRNRRYFDREAIYSYEDNDVAPFVLLSKAVVTFSAADGWVPDIIHCHDWHLGLAPEYARRGPHRAALDRTATILTIHNLAYQGHLGSDTEALIGLGSHGEGTLLARGITYADAVNTVSRRYLEEILTPEHGMGLDGLLRSRRRDLFGILNGVDYEEFDPRTDSRIPARYDASFLEAKSIDKLALQRLSGLAVDPGAPLLGMVARLVDQKGVDLVCAGLGDMVALGAQVVVAGRGDERYQRALRAAVTQHAGSVSYHSESDEGLARLVYAGSDFFLAPSAYEPCGLAPLIALRYGTIPIVRRTGGLAETIRDYSQNPESGFGFTFSRKHPRELVGAIREGLEVHRREDQWRALQRRAAIRHLPD